MKKALKGILYSFPIQLVVLHFRSNHLLLLFWLILIGGISGAIGTGYGMKFLFLDPEYIGQINFYSFFIIGLAFGGFMMAWNISVYILHSFRFPFLASLSRPFTKFCLNNSLIPIIFVSLYMGIMISFQWYNEFADPNDILYYVAGFFAGLIIALLLASLYFQLTNKDVFSFENTPISGKLREKVRKKDEAQIAKDPYAFAWPVDYFITENFAIRLVRDVRHYDPNLLIRVFRQNHINALILQVSSIVLIIALGLLMDHPLFRIPAGASLLLLFAIITMLISSMHYWLRKWRTFVFVFVLLLINYMTSTHTFSHQNQAYGLNYETEKAIYSHASLEAMGSKENYYEDKDSTLLMLQNWRSKFSEGRLIRKPKMVIVSVSGGGMRAGMWSMRVLQEADKSLNGELMNHTVLMTGASGGMLGSAFMRDLYCQKQQEDSLDIHDERYLNMIAMDLLNPIMFTVVANDLFVPWMRFEANGYTYRKDRGYSFEKQLIENTEGALGRPIGFYKQMVSEGKAPMMLISPIVINDGRALLISSQKVSYMTRTHLGVQRPELSEFDGIDFGRFFEKQDAANLRLSSALRMNATYPYILPTVHLPTEPNLEVMDAGWRDNFGASHAYRFVYVFNEWIKKNTSGVVFVQIRDSHKIEDITKGHSQGILSRTFNPLGLINHMSDIQDFQHDEQLSYLSELLGKDKIDLVYFTYKPNKVNRPASMSFHLTKREKIDIMNSMYDEENAANLKRLKELVK